jgi:CRP/FNR family cyclic AMP-dependent transcriptional regulator
LTAPEREHERGSAGNVTVGGEDASGGALAGLAFFEGADPAALAAAEPLARWVTVGAGALVLDFGDATDDVFVVVEGMVRVVVRTPLGQDLILGDRGAGEVVGEMAAISGASRSANVIALYPTRLCRLPAAAFLEVALRSPAVGLRVMRTLAARLRLQEERMLERVALRVRHRLAAELLRLSRPRGPEAKGGAGARVVSPAPPHHVLGARIGARREAVQIALAELARDGLAEVSPRAIVLPQPEALRQAVQAYLRADTDAEGDRKRGRRPPR